MPANAFSETMPLAVERASNGDYLVSVLTNEGVVDLGRHARITDVWAAIDTIDAPRRTAPLRQAA